MRPMWISMQAPATVVLLAILLVPSGTYGKQSNGDVSALGMQMPDANFNATMNTRRRLKFFDFGLFDDDDDAYEAYDDDDVRGRDGADCSSNSGCSSGVCKGGKCCGSKGKSKGCISCDVDGDCAVCSSPTYVRKSYQCFVAEYSVSNCLDDATAYSTGCCKGSCSNSYDACWECPTTKSENSKNYGGKQCFAAGSCRHFVTTTATATTTTATATTTTTKTGNGGLCMSSSSCSSGVCRGGDPFASWWDIGSRFGRCCGLTPGPSTTSCTRCNSAGKCNACSAGFRLFGGECARETTMTTTTTTTTKKSDGSRCSSPSECLSAGCKGGICCSVGQSNGCSTCAPDPTSSGRGGSYAADCTPTVNECGQNPECCCGCDSSVKTLLGVSRCTLGGGCCGAKCHCPAGSSGVDPLICADDAANADNGKDPANDDTDMYYACVQDVNVVNVVNGVCHTLYEERACKRTRGCAWELQQAFYGYNGIIGDYYGSYAGSDEPTPAGTCIVCEKGHTLQTSSTGVSSCALIIEKTCLSVQISGCGSFLGGQYASKGRTKDGKEYFQGTSNGYYLFYDKDCGYSTNQADKWIFDNSKPSLVRDADLDGDNTCRYYGAIDTTSAAPPTGRNTWKFGCSDWKSVDVGLEQVPCVTTTTTTATTTTITATTYTISTTTTTVTATTKTSTTTATTTTTYGYNGAVNCPTSCTQSMFENMDCDPECNNYECRYDQGTCSPNMAKELQRARTLAIIGGRDDALLLFEDLCDNIGTKEDPPDPAPDAIEAAEHSDRLREFKVQQSFTWISCSAADSLKLGKSFYGKAPNEVTGSLSWMHLQKGVNERLNLLDTMDSEINTFNQLAATVAAAQRVETVVTSSLSEVAGELKDYIGESVDGLKQKLDEQTQQMNKLAQHNEEKLDRAAALQRRILTQSIENGEDLQELEATVDEIAADTDLLLKGVEDLKSRADFMLEYSVKTRELITSELQELSATQRTTLEQVMENADALDDLDDDTKQVMTAVLANRQKLEDLSADQRNLLNTVLESREITNAKLDKILATTEELSATQRLTLVQIRRNSASLESLTAETRQILTSVLDNGGTLQDLTAGQRTLINAAMNSELNAGPSCQGDEEECTLTAYSMAWDDNGDGKASPQELVGITSDLAVSSSTAVGKVLAGFKTAASMVFSKARSLVSKHLGGDAAAVFDNLKGKLASVSANDVFDVMKKAKKITSTVTKVWDTMKSFDGKSWKSVASSTFNMASQLFGRGDNRPEIQRAAGLAKQFSTVLSSTGKGSSVAAFAASASGAITGVGECIKVAKSAKTAATAGTAVGGPIGTVVSLVYSGFTGSLGKCTKTLQKVGKKIVEGVKKYAPIIAKGTKKVVTSIVKGGTAVVSTTAKVAKKVVKVGVTVAKGAVKVGFSVVKGAAKFGLGAVEGAANSVAAVANALCFWCRRGRRSGEIHVEFDFEEDEDAITNVDELLADVEKLAGATENFYNAADGLYFNISKGIDLDVGVLSHPDIEAKYSTDRDSNVFAESLLTVQAYAQQRADLEAQFQTDTYLTDNVGRCLLNGDCDLKDKVDRYQMALDYLEMKRGAVVFNILEGFVEMNNAFRYELLRDKLQFMLGESPTSSDLRTLMTRFTDEHKSALNDEGGMATEASVHYTFRESDAPQAFAELKDTGIGFFIIPAAEQSFARDLRVSGYDVGAFVYPSNDNTSTTASVQISKGGYSTFYPIETMSEPLTFLHTDITDNRVGSFVYNPQTCAAITKPCTSKKCRDKEFLNVSPYGEWKLKVADKQSLAILQNATEVRMAFTVSWHTSSDGKTANYTQAMFGNDKCESVCYIEDGKPVVTAEECELPTELTVEPATTPAVEASSSTGMSSGGKAGLAIGILACFAVVAALVVKAKDKKRELPQHSRGHNGYTNPHYSAPTEKVVEVWKSGVATQKGLGDKQLNLNDTNETFGGFESAATDAHEEPTYDLSTNGDGYLDVDGADSDDGSDIDL